MNVEDGLSATNPGVEHQAEVTIGVLVSQVSRHLHHLLEKRRVACSELRHIPVRIGFRDNQQVDGSFRGDIAQSDDSVVLEHDVRRDLTGNNPRENRWLAHEHQSRTRACMSHPVITSAPSRY